MKKIIGVISLVLFAFILFQSCVAGLGNAFFEDSNVTSGSSGAIMAFAILIAGILSLISRYKKTPTFAASLFFFISAIIGIVEPNPYGDLVIWTWMSGIFGILIIISFFKNKKMYN